MWELIEEYLEEVFGCSSSLSAQRQNQCLAIPRLELERRFQQDPYISFVVKAVSALTAAYRLSELERQSDNVISDLDLHERVLDNLKKLSFTSMMKKFDVVNDDHDEEEDHRQHFSSTGRLVAGRQQIFRVDHELGLQQVNELNSRLFVIF